MQTKNLSRQQEKATLREQAAVTLCLDKGPHPVLHVTERRWLMVRQEGRFYLIAFFFFFQIESVYVTQSGLKLKLVQGWP